MVAGACGAAMVVLGFYVYRGNRGARVAVSVLAFPLLVSGFYVGGFMVTLVAIATGTLWLQPARDWFNGVAPTPKREIARWRRRQNRVPAASAAGWPPPLVVTNDAVRHTSFGRRRTASDPER